MLSITFFFFARKENRRNPPFMKRRAICEGLFIFLLSILFLSMLLVESMAVFDGNRPNFFYEIHVQHYLSPKLATLEDPSAVLQMAMEENRDSTIYIWRQVVFMSIFVSFLSLLLVKIYYLDCPWSMFILLFLSVFFSSFLLFTLITYHYFANRASFVDQCLQKYHTLLVDSSSSKERVDPSVFGSGSETKGDERLHNSAR